jgi:hypothetical protein
MCIAVLGRNVRSLGFLAVLFSEGPALKPHVRFYQRLLARDAVEASDMLKQRMATGTRVQVVDEVDHCHRLDLARSRSAQILPRAALAIA